MTVSRHWVSQVKTIISPLLPELHKGQAGRVCVLGGCREYTGAPYYASMSSMRLGCDMSFTVCAPEAAPAIKSYSPDLIVHPLLDQRKSQEDVRAELRTLFQRLHSVIIGPGLGRDDYMQSFARVAIEVARESNLYMVIDADGLWLVQNTPEVIQGYRRAVLTPNVVEFQRLCRAVVRAAHLTRRASRLLMVRRSGSARRWVALRFWRRAVSTVSRPPKMWSNATSGAA